MSLWAVVRLAGRRLARGGGRYLLVVLGIAAAAAVLAGIETASVSAGDRSLGRAVQAIPAAERGSRVDWTGIPAQGGAPYTQLDATARQKLGELGGRIWGATLFREAEMGGALTDLAAIDDVGHWVRLRSGRLPRPCTPARCEVVQLAGSGPLPRLPGLNVVRVGRGSIASPFPFGSLLTHTSASSILREALRYHQPAQPPFLLADGVSGLASARVLAGFQRSYSWLQPLDQRSLHTWSAGTFADRSAQVRSELESNAQPFDLQAPADQISAAATTARVGQRRLLLLGGVGAALLLSFTVLAAVAGRREARATGRRLTWLGARLWQVVLLDAAEAVAAALVGVVLGWAAGIGLGAAVANRLGEPAVTALAHAAASGTGIGLAAALGAAAALVLVLTRRTGALSFGGVSLTVADALALGALVAIAVGSLRGSADASSLARNDRTGVFLLLLPGLAVFVAAVASARLLYPGLRLLERASRRASTPVRLAVISLARSPGRSAVVVTFLVATFGLALFAADYRATLTRGRADEASYAVPAAAVVRESLDTLEPVPAVAPLADYRRLGSVAPVLRLQGDVSALTTSQGFTLLGIPPSRLHGLRGWRGDFSSLSTAELASRIAPRGSAAMRGVRLPAGAQTLELPTVARGTPLEVKATVMTPRGLFRTIDLGRAGGRRVLRARLAPSLRGGLVVRLTFIRAGGLPFGTNAGLGGQPLTAGRLTLGGFRAGGQPVATDYSRWTAGPGVHASEGRLRYLLSPESGNPIGTFRPRQPTDGKAIPAVVSPALAAAAGQNGELPVEVDDQPLLLRVAAVVSRFPTTQGDLVVADRTSVATALNAAAPGTGVTNELWIDARPGSSPRALVSALHRPPFDVLAVSSHAALLSRLRSDPLGRGSVLVLGATAVAALALALVGLLLALAFDLRDERGELFDLEAQGAEPRTLLRHLRLRFLLGACFGVLGGLAVGTALSAVAVGLVRLTAGATEPVPPLRLVLDWRLAGIGLAAFAIAAGLLALWLTRAGLARAERQGEAPA